MNCFFIEGYFEKYTFSNSSLIQLVELVKSNGQLYNRAVFADINIYETFDRITEEGLRYLEEIDLDEEGLMLTADDNKYFHFSRGKGSDWFKMSYIGSLLLEDMVKNVITALIGPKLKACFLGDFWYTFFQSTDTISGYMSQGLEYRHLPIYFSQKLQMEMIDISQNEGRERFLPDLKFMPSYKIWFGEQAQKLFGGSKYILEYKGAISLKRLDSGIIEMQLMDDIKRSNLPYNKEKQKEIVKYLGIEKLEVSRWYQSN